MLKLEHLSKSYAKGAVKAVDALSLTVAPGEIFGFIGPNGAGKTTTIKMICGVVNPDEGRIVINGHDIAQDPIAAKRMIGYVPDAAIPYERLTGMEYLCFMADVYGVDAQARKHQIDKYLTLFELRAAAGDQIRSYSHGMRQKLMITGALLHSPPLWILDEPMGGLDPRASHLLKQEMRSHCDRGSTVFFSTHVLEVAERLCDRIGIIDHGALVAVGTMDELRSGNQGASLEALFLRLTDEGEDGA